MSKEYDDYLKKHVANVRVGFEWLRKHLPELFEDEPANLMISIACHDLSKYNSEEYYAYDNYFYGNNRSYEVVESFKYAWLEHIHNNCHHWQYWVLINDDPKNGITVLDMPYEYIIEMICDWWAFSWASGNLYEIFSWYETRKDYIKLSDNTRKTVEDILDKIKSKLDEQNQSN